MKIYRFSFGASVLSLIFASANTYADLNRGMSVGFQSKWQDNISKTSTNRESGVVNSINFGVKLDGEQRYYTYGGDYVIKHEWYSDSNFENSNYFNGRLFLNLEILPGRFFWNNKLISAVSLRNSNTPNIPTNRDQRTSISTAPSLVLIKTKRSSLTANASASKTYYREAEQNGGINKGVNLDYSYQFSKLVSGGVTCGFQKTEFDSEADYNARECALNMSRRLKQGAASFSIGKTNTDPSAGVDVDGTTYAVQVDWGLENNRYYFLSNRAITDTTAAGIFIEFDEDAITPIDVNTDILDLVARTRTEAGVSRDINAKLSATFFLYRDKLDLYNSLEDTVRDGIGLNIGRDFIANTTLELTYRFEKSVFGEQTSLQSTSYSSKYKLSTKYNYSDALNFSMFVDAEDKRADIEFDTYEAYSIGVAGTLSF